jgi:hypothetical protein
VELKYGLVDRSQDEMVGLEVGETIINSDGDTDGDEDGSWV